MGNTTALLGFTCAAGVLRAGRTETGKGASTTSAAEGELAKRIAQLRAEGKLGGAEGSEGGAGAGPSAEGPEDGASGTGAA